MQINPTLIVSLDYGVALAFEGKFAPEFIKLLSSARIVEQTSRHGSYGWWPVDKDSDSRVRTELLTRSLSDHGDTVAMRNELDDLRAKLRKHQELIEAAEALEGGEGS